MIGPDSRLRRPGHLGGMIGTNASAAHSIEHGMTADHLLASELYLSGGDSLRLEGMSAAEAGRRARSGGRKAASWRRVWRSGRTDAAAIEPAAAYLASRQRLGLNYLTGCSRSAPPSWDAEYRPYMPARLGGHPRSLHGLRGTTGYPPPGDRFNLVPRPVATVLVVLTFDSVVEACDAHTGRPELTASSSNSYRRRCSMRARSIPAFGRRLGISSTGRAGGTAGGRVHGPGRRAEAFAAAGRLKVQGTCIATPDGQADVWAVRKAGLGLLMSEPGDRKPVEFIEDVAVPVDRALGVHTTSRRDPSRERHIGRMVRPRFRRVSAHAPRP